jgi:transposase InsO family protein
MIKHNLTKPFTPKTNGMVERFNRRIGDALKQRQPIKHDGTRFETCQEREDFIKDFVYRYNHTRLVCLLYQTPLSLLHNQKE